MLRSFLSFCLSLFKSTSQVRLENIYLRKQLEILARTSTIPRLRPSDRFFFSVMTDAFNSWKDALLVFKPKTVIHWHRQSFRLFWRWKSRSELGRPRIPRAQINLIKQMANQHLSGELHYRINPRWSIRIRSTMVNPQLTTRGEEKVIEEIGKSGGEM